MKYLEQKARMERLYKKINPESGFHGDQIEYEDNLWFFFQTAWHLKDWIRNDPEVEPCRISKVVENYKNLRICADLANSTKHLELKCLTVEEAISGKIPIIRSMGSKYIYWISDKEGNRYSAITLAEQIMKDWDKIISDHVRPKTT